MVLTAKPFQLDDSAKWTISRQALAIFSSQKPVEPRLTFRERTGVKNVGSNAILVLSIAISTPPICFDQMWQVRLGFPITCTNASLCLELVQSWRNQNTTWTKSINFSTSCSLPSSPASALHCMVQRNTVWLCCNYRPPLVVCSPIYNLHSQPMEFVTLISTAELQGLTCTMQQ